MAESFDVGVAAAVVTDTGILLVQEAKGTYAGCWGLPKGHVEPNESIENAVPVSYTHLTLPTICSV